MKGTFETRDSIAVKIPRLKPHHPQHLCLDKGYDFRDQNRRDRQAIHPSHETQGRDIEPCEAIQAEAIGSREERVMAQPVQEAPHLTGEGQELSWVSSARMLPNRLQEDNFRIGS